MARKKLEEAINTASTYLGLEVTSSVIDFNANYGALLKFVLPSQF